MLGGKGYTDEPKKFINNNFSDKKDSLKLLFIGNSRIRDLINSFISSKKINKKFLEIVYVMQFNPENKSIQNNIKKADIIFSQIPKIKYNPEKSIFIFAKEREDFIYNMNPLILIKDREKRKNFKVFKHNQPQNLFIKKNSSYFELNEISAFLDQEGYLRFTDAEGNIISFDGVHLSNSGANILINALESDSIFNKLIYKFNKKITQN